MIAIATRTKIQACSVHTVIVVSVCTERVHNHQYNNKKEVQKCHNHGRVDRWLTVSTLLILLVQNHAQNVNACIHKTGLVCIGNCNSCKDNQII